MACSLGGCGWENSWSLSAAKPGLKSAAPTVPPWGLCSPRTVRMKMVASARLQKGCSWSLKHNNVKFGHYGANSVHHLSAAKPGLKWPDWQQAGSVPDTGDRPYQTPQPRAGVNILANFRGQGCIFFKLSGAHSSTDGGIASNSPSPSHTTALPITTHQPKEDLLNMSNRVKGHTVHNMKIFIKYMWLYETIL